jgi:exodeoxyribonuclease VII small subunit
MAEKKKTYEEALKRLEEIMSKIDSGTLDIDSLSDNLKQAQGLLAFCRDKLHRVDQEIQQLLQEESASDEK